MGLNYFFYFFERRILSSFLAPTPRIIRIIKLGIRQIIRSLQAKGIAILFVSHRLQELFTIADRMTVLRDGRCMGTYPKEDLSEEKLISLMVGRKVESVRQQREQEIGPPLLEVRSLSKKGNFRDISFTLHRGEILALTGLVGAGRTEVGQAIFGLNRPDSGEVILDGKRINVRSPEEALRQGIAYIPENRQVEGLIMKQSVAANISLAVLRRLRNGLGLLSPAKEIQLVQEYMRALDVRPPYPHMLAMQLSGGNQQRTVLAKWLATQPQVLIVDEPTNGIDVGAKAEIHRLLRQLASQGMGILMISSELPEVLAVSDRILVMRRGRIVGEFRTDEATQEKIMGKALLGGAANGAETAGVAAGGEGELAELPYPQASVAGRGGRK